ncbi:Hypothetical predicted protein [Pelobates cultripes]|uniref:Uncharacterized protein n=1 Tax=Pelobates cultripes TaxID=61616 RepID=A0AAD1TCL6_PELCU|nr:Hypothetical predicted protein [Pelobates cultripes]
MGKKTCKYWPDRSEGFHDIEDLLRTRLQPKMAALPRRSPSCSSEDLEYVAPDPIPEVRATSARKDNRAPKVDEDSAPTTKGDLKHLLNELRTMFQADCAKIREDM